MSDVLDLGHLLVRASFSYHIIKNISTAELVKIGRASCSEIVFQYV